MKNAPGPGPGDLDPTEIARYRRHLVLPEVGLGGQLRLRASSVLVVGAGGLGSPLALYLAAAGVGRIGLVDFDTVELSNLQRQILYGSADVGRTKLAAAADRLRDVNPRVQVEAHDGRLVAANAARIVEAYDVIADGTDNFPARYLVNDACVLADKPNVHGSVFRFEGQVSVFHARRGPCYRCLFPVPPAPGAVPNCAEAGVLGALPGIIGSLQAIETIKYILGQGESLCGRLLLFDALALRFRELRLRKDPDCPVCGEHPTIRELSDVAPACDLQDASGGGEIDPRRLRDLLAGSEPPLLLDVRTPEEWAICRLPGARLIPLQELERRIEELDRSREIVVYCHAGMRSAMAAGLLRRSGHARVSNLAGGIDGWSLLVDPATPRY